MTGSTVTRASAGRQWRRCGSPSRPCCGAATPSPRSTSCSGFPPTTRHRCPETVGSRWSAVAVTEVIVPAGPYRLQESVEFGFGPRHAQQFDGVMRMAFALDGTWAPAAVAVRQPQEDGPVEVEVIGSADPARAAAQTARVLSR